MTRNRKSPHVALYGAVAMQRLWCADCDGMALIVHGKFACCDRDPDATASAVKRMCSSPDLRRRPSRMTQIEILQAQQNRCLYCEVNFGAIVNRNGKFYKLKVVWDHLVPFSYTGSSLDCEFVAACQVCNGLKSATMYATVEDARTRLALAREEKGWSF